MRPCTAGANWKWIECTNLQPDNVDLVTLHIYSPPLLVMGQYSLLDRAVREFKDEVYAFTEGAGI